jgi:polyferredoxin
MRIIENIGLGLFFTALIVFTASLGIGHYALTPESLEQSISNPHHRRALTEQAQARGMMGQRYATSFEFVPAFKELLDAAQQSLEQQAKEELPEGVSKIDVRLASWRFKDYTYQAARQSAGGPVARQPWLFFFLTFGLAILGGLLYSLPKFRLIPGIKHDHIYHHPMTRGVSMRWRSFFLGAALIGMLLYGVFYMGKAYFWPAVSAAMALLIIGLVLFAERQRRNSPARSASTQATGWLGILTGLYLIGFYVLLYWAPQHIINWTLIVDPLSQALNGGAASQWFLYGLLYTLIMVVMGVRMLAKYQHNRYQRIRTWSVMFFQTAFAFLIPEILVRLNYPYYDFKNIWPLNYSFFFDWNLKSLLDSGALGLFMLGWGIALIVVAVPVITYFYGKRWYCSWVCGCGGLAETLGDPYRQLSDKSLHAWKYERWIIHGVLVFAVIMTMGVLHSFLPKNEAWLNQRNFLLLSMLLLAGTMGYLYYRWAKGSVDISKLGIRVGLGVTVLLIGVSAYHLYTGSEHFLFLNSNSTRQWYGFLIGSAFAGVVGTGFYPIMGNRVWCRFGCPLAAYLGLVQRFKSRFRITTNGGQCISCGNCSTYCEMGIDVRAYAQRGQDIVRSSCVGCGICSAVCPRGVLRLENSGLDISERMQDIRTELIRGK